MTSVRYTKFRDIDSSVLQIIQSTHRGEDLSALTKWGEETVTYRRKKPIGNANDTTSESATIAGNP